MTAIRAWAIKDRNGAIVFCHFGLDEHATQEWWLRTHLYICYWNQATEHGFTCVPVEIREHTAQDAALLRECRERLLVSGGIWRHTDGNLVGANETMLDLVKRIDAYFAHGEAKHE